MWIPINEELPVLDRKGKDSLISDEVIVANIEAGKIINFGYGFLRKDSLKNELVDPNAAPVWHIDNSKINWKPTHWAIQPVFLNHERRNRVRNWLRFKTKKPQARGYEVDFMPGVVG